MKIIFLLVRSLFVLNLACGLVGFVSAQTTLSGNHVVAGATGSSAGPGLMVTGDGGVIFEGQAGVGQMPTSSTGALMFWYPGKAAFRAGYHFDSIFDEQIGFNSAAFGESIASGYGSFATGNAVAAGDASFATGVGTASGVCSSAFGCSSVATALASTSIGCGNVEDTSQNATDWIATDQLFVIGNGWTVASNALVMRKNANLRTGGEIEAKGGMRTPPLGDIGMGSFTAGQNPATLNSALKYSGE